MKILCISDQIDPLIYSQNVKSRFKDINFVISAGDLPLEYIDFIMSMLNKNVYFVFGNHNLEQFHTYHTNISPVQAPVIPPTELCKTKYGGTYLGFTTKQEGSVLMAGLSGSLKYNNGLCQYTELQMKLQILKLLPRLLWNKVRYGRYLDILVTHAPPYGIHDKEDRCHRGFKCFLKFMDVFKPAYLLHGHIHLYDMNDTRITKYNETTIVNVFSHYILKLDEKNNG